MARKALTVAEVIAGEARSPEDLEMIASVIVNRAMMAGVSLEDVTFAPGQFDAYDKKLPAGTTEADVKRAQAAIDKVLKEGVPAKYQTAIGYARDYAVGNIPGTWERTGVVTPDKHVVFSDPNGGWIATTGGYVAPQEPSLPAIDTADPFSLDDPDHPSTPGWLSGPVAATPVDVESFSLPDIGPDLGVRPGGGLQDVADVTKGAWRAMPGANIEGVDPRLSDILSRAAVDFEAQNPGYSVQGFSGRRARSTGTRNHPAGMAIDVNIVDPAGNVLDNLQNGDTFPAYQGFANIARGIQQSDYPELSGSFRWGGYFQQGTPLDQMHFDIGGGGMALGSWEGGLNEQGRQLMARFGFPNVQSVGLSQMAQNVPTPTPRPDFNPTAVASALPSLTATASGTLPGLSNITSEPLAPLGAEAVPSIVSTAEAAPSLPSEVVSPMTSEALSPLASETVSPTNDAIPATAFGPAAPISGFEPMSMGALGAMAGSMVGPAPQSSFPARPGVPGALPAADVVSPVPGLPAAPTVTPTVNPTMMDPTPLADQTAQLPTLPDQPAPTVSDQFPPAPEISNWDKFKSVAKPIAKNAMLGNSLFGLPGMAAGAVYGALPAMGVDVDFGPQFDNVVPDSARFSTGYGLAGINAAMGGPFGAQGFSLSNPGMSFTSLGNGMGLRRSDKYGWTEVVGPDGSVRGIHFDDPMGGGFIGNVSRAVGGYLGGDRDISREARDAMSRGPGLY